jgi:hypothetical protein
VKLILVFLSTVAKIEKFQKKTLNSHTTVADLNATSADIGEVQILLEAMLLDVRVKKLLAHRFLLRYGTGYETVGLVKDTFESPHPRSGLNGLDLLGPALRQVRSTLPLCHFQCSTIIHCLYIQFQ